MAALASIVASVVVMVVDEGSGAYQVGRLAAYAFFVLVAFALLRKLLKR